MAAQTLKQRPAETVRKVAELALADAVEITLLIALMQGQNTGGVNDRLNKAGAGRAALRVKPPHRGGEWRQPPALNANIRLSPTALPNR